MADKCRRRVITRSRRAYMCSQHCRTAEILRVAAAIIATLICAHLGVPTTYHHQLEISTYRSLVVLSSDISTLWGNLNIRGVGYFLDALFNYFEIFFLCFDVYRNLRLTGTQPYSIPYNFRRTQFVCKLFTRTLGIAPPSQFSSSIDKHINLVNVKLPTLSCPGSMI
jgi:hypothetical protein